MSRRVAMLFVADRAVSELARTELERRGYAVRVTASGDELVVGASTCELILVELSAAGAELATVIQSLRVRPPGVRTSLVGLAPAGARAAVARAIALGVADVVLVPCTADELALRLDVVERREAERRALLELMGHMPDFVIMLDREGAVSFINRDSPGGSVEQVVGRPGLQHLLPEHRARVREAFERARTTGQAQSFEAASYFGLTYRSHMVPMWRDGAFDGAAIVATDITEQRWTEAELKAQSAKAAAILSALPDSVLWLRRDGELLDVHAEAHGDLFGPAGTVIGRRVQDVLPADLATTLLAQLEVALGTGRTQVFEYQRPGATELTDLEARVVASGRDDGVVIIRDVTQRRRMQAQLAIADRLAALGTLAAGVAHEINNPLTYVLIGVETVAKELRRRTGELGDRAHVLVERLEGALEGARRVRRIVADLKAFARAEDEETHVVDLVAVVDSVTAMVDSQVRYRGRIEKDLQPVPRVAASADRLTQVFLNLLINAAQALPEETAADNLIRLRVASEAGKVVVEVSDSGHGIAPEHLARIFDPFFTTKPVGVGTGLGLWICHTIITSYGGQITVDSRLGHGTTFRVVLPAAATLAAPAPTVAEEDLPWAGRILIIDDDDKVAGSLALLFDGADVVTLSSGRAAIAHLCQVTPPAYDWIFCDLMMVGVSGIEVYEAVRQARPGAEQRFVFMTGGAFTPRATEFLAQVTCPILAKPFRQAELGAILRARAAALRGE